MKKYIEIRLGSELYQFERIKLDIIEKDIQDIFSKKNNKTLGETLNHCRYSKLRESYKTDLDISLGIFLKNLKDKGDCGYKSFLNKYGDGKFCKFEINKYLNDAGIYCFIVDNEIKYVGRCMDNFKKRFNQGYGSISPKNCYIDGQATNCHINSLVNSMIREGKNVEIGIHKMDNRTEEEKKNIKELEKLILKSKSYKWNIIHNSERKQKQNNIP